MGGERGEKPSSRKREMIKDHGNGLSLALAIATTGGKSMYDWPLQNCYHLILSCFMLSDTLGKEVKWPDSMYPDLHMPYAPSWSLHWAYRDGHLVNLPVSLLVEGDVIALRPGQESFASLRGIKVTCLSYFSSL